MSGKPKNSFIQSESMPGENWFLVTDCWLLFFGMDPWIAQHPVTHRKTEESKSN
uniref:Uncharacterized protein n=1 Tax=Arundo donax TaxID=35708 RepID=A0A0A9BHR1_ARUDO